MRLAKSAGAVYDCLVLFDDKSVETSLKSLHMLQLLLDHITVQPNKPIKYSRALRPEYCIVGIPHNTSFNMIPRACGSLVSNYFCCYIF